MSILHETFSAGLAARQRAAGERTKVLGDLYPFRPHFHDHDGLFQHYLDEGSPGGEVLLCLHGNPTWSFYWRDLVRELQGDHRLVVPDHIGCGLSDKPQGDAYTLTAHVERIDALVDALGLTNITLVLHDWGGAIGMGFARRRPHLIRRIVVTNTGAFRSHQIPLRIAACRIPFFGKLAVRGLNAFARAATFMAVEQPLSQATKRGYLLPYDSWETRIATHAFVEDIPLGPEHPSYAELTAIEEALPEFQNRPMRILWGERDWCFTPRFRERWQSYFPDAQVQRFEAAGHYLMEDAGVEVIASIRAFLAETAEL